MRSHTTVESYQPDTLTQCTAGTTHTHTQACYTLCTLGTLCTQAGIILIRNGVRTRFMDQSQNRIALCTEKPRQDFEQQARSVRSASNSFNLPAIDDVINCKSLLTMQK